MNFRDEVKAALHEALDDLGFDVAHDVGDDVHLFDDLGFDSFDLVDVLLCVEDLLSIRVNEAELSEVWTVGDTIGVISRAITAARS